MDISDELKDYLQEAFTIWVCLVLSCCGVVTNTSSIIVFTKQGFRDNVSISLTAIAVADDLRCIIGLFRTVYGPLKLGGHISVAKVSSLPVYWKETNICVPETADLVYKRKELTNVFKACYKSTHSFARSYR